MENFKFICKKSFKNKDHTKEFFVVHLYQVEQDSIITIYTNDKCYNKLLYKFGDTIKSSEITSSSYVDQYGRTITSFKLV